MKSGKPRKAPKVAIPSKKNPMVMREYDTPAIRKSPMLPMKSKRLSK